MRCTEMIIEVRYRCDSLFEVERGHCGSEYRVVSTDSSPYDGQAGYAVVTLIDLFCCDFERPTGAVTTSQETLTVRKERRISSTGRHSATAIDRSSGRKSSIGFKFCGYLSESRNAR